MANPIAIAAALARTVAVTCPHCGFKKLVSKKKVAFRVCPRCKRHFTDTQGKKQ